MDLKTGHGCQRWAKFIHPTTGQRQNAADSFIRPLTGKSSLRVLTKTKVVRVLLDGTKATGVEVVANKVQDADADQAPRTITARKLVVISSGAIESPLVLQRSGIGAEEKLATVGVKPVVELPGVGASYQDHTLTKLLFRVPGDSESFDPLLEQEPGWVEQHFPLFMQGKGLLTSNMIDAGSKLRPTPEELEEFGLEFKEFWKKHFEAKPDKAVVLQGIANAVFGPRDGIPKGTRMLTLGNFTTHPVSRGYIHITSTNPYTPPDLNIGVFDHQADVDVHVWAYKKGREIARRMPHYRGEYAPLHPKFPEGSAAACVEIESPPQTSGLKNLNYTEADNAAIEAYVRQTGDTSWHSCGTIPMKPKEEGGCVDARLNVYGTQNLKVADLSILLGHVSANPNSTALLVGEKAAVLIAEDLGLNLS
ncbi:hypothetical protein FRC12_008612 [Ceratobasidium sp. 428]|nr:hypothetical protein FRC12_008612 [Ceratobasidium sp. 428]